MHLHWGVRYDLGVVGGGSAGLAAASFAAGMGARVVLFEADRLGGDCTWTGCVPSKALVHAAGVVHRARTAGWLDAGALDFGAVMRDVRSAAARVAEQESAAPLQARGIEVVLGRARFVDPGSVEADGRRWEARRFVVCTGAGPALPPVSGLREAQHLTYRTVFDLDRLPRRLLVLGGGAVGAELAQALQRLGSRVTILEQAGRLLPMAVPAASAVLQERFRREGIEVVLGAAAERVEIAGGEVALVAAGKRCVADALLVAAGRTPNVAGLGLDRVGVTVGPGGIEVDDAMRTSQRHIYAAGDVTGALQFTHYAVWQGYAAARNALFPGRERGVRSSVPWAVFTDPEVAQVGLTEAAARAAVRRVAVHHLPVDRIDRAQTEGETDGFLELVTGAGDRILGATIVSAGAADLANQLAGAIDAGIGLSRLARVVHVYPTRGYALPLLAASVRMERAASGPLVRLLRRLTWIR